MLSGYFKSKERVKFTSAFSWLGLISILAIMTQLTGCSTANTVAYSSSRDGAPTQYVDASKIPDAVPQIEPRSRYGNPSSYIVDGYRYRVLSSAKGYDKIGYASWYGTKFHDKLTSTRETYNMLSMTAASTILPLPTYVRVTNLDNGRSVIVKVNDRGPFRSNRIIDLSYAAALKLGYANKGTARVRVTAIDPAVWLAENKRRRSESQYASYSTQQPTLADNNVSTKYSAYTTNTAKQSTTANAVYLQIGAFANKTTAKNLSARIAALTNEPVKITPIYQANRAIYKVHVGPIYDTAQYAQLRQQLIAHGFGNPIMVNG